MLAMLMLLSVNIPAFAATKPTVQCTYQSASTIKRGKSVKFRFYLKSNSYKKTSAGWRSRVIFWCNYKGVNGPQVAKNDRVFTGNSYFTWTLKTSKKQATGKYYVNWMVAYRGSAYGTWYSTNGNRVAYKIFTVKK